MGITVSIEEVTIFEDTMTLQFSSEISTLQEQAKYMNEKLQQTLTERNTLKNEIGVEKAEILLKETGYYESKEYYKETDETDCASMTKIEESDDESITESLNDRFRNLAIPPSMKAIGKRPVSADSPQIGQEGGEGEGEETKAERNRKEKTQKK
ncbi:hypothetical protein C1645_735111 [Glomus cerebriforme]|uniref:Uncharacterized protein n=1 Tax=Glomus cerebriforme TaxID=658196 RepID=A0A397TGK1_9GLOM|nr:hypothetical protein C1645_735111 [Glomus cerebriforme]